MAKFDALFEEFAAEGARRAPPAAPRATPMDALFEEFESGAGESPEGGAPLPEGEFSTPEAAAIQQEIPRALARGAGQTFEMGMDIAESIPGASILPRAAGAALEYFTTGSTQGFEDIASNPLTGFGQETAGDRLRARAAEATEGLHRRRFRREDLGPGATPWLTTAEAVGGGAAAGGLMSAPGAAATFAGGLGAGAARGAAEGAGLGEFGQDVAEVAGALLAPTSPRAVVDAARAVGGTARELGTRARSLGQFATGRVPDTRRREAVNVLRRALESRGENVDDIAESTAAAIARGDEGTLGTLSGSRSAQGVEKALLEAAESQEAQGIRQQFAAAGQATRQAAADRVAAIAQEGDPERASLAVKQLRQERSNQGLRAANTLRQRQADIENAATAAEQGVLTRAAGTPDPADSGLALSEAIDAAAEVAKGRERTWWGLVPTSEQIPRDTVLSRLDKHLEGMNSVQRGRFEKAFGSEIASARNLPERVSGAELNDLRSAISASMADEVKTGGRAKDLDRLATQWLSDLQDVIDESPGGETFRRARQATADYYRTFQGGTLGRSLRATREGRGGTPETLGERTVRGKTGAGRKVDDALAAEEFTQPGAVRGPLEDSLRAEFYRTAAPPGGNVNPRAAERFLADQREALKRFPGLTEELTEELAELRKAAEGREAAKGMRPGIERVRAGAGGAFPQARNLTRRALDDFVAGGQGAVEAAKTALASRDRVQRVGNLARAAMRRGAPPGAREGMQRAFREAYADTVASDVELAGDMRKALAKVFDKDQMRTFDEAQDLMARLSRDQAIPIDSELLQRQPSAARGFTVILARMAGAKIGGVVSGQPLIASGIASAMAKRGLEALPARQHRKLLAAYITDPDVFLRDLERFNAPDLTAPEAEAIADRVLDTLMARTGVVAQAGDED